jgi:hypothetical protein
MWIVYDVTTKTQDFSIGADTTEVAFIDPHTLKNSEHLSERLVYKFTVDMSAEIL